MTSMIQDVIQVQNVQISLVEKAFWVPWGCNSCRFICSHLSTVNMGPIWSYCQSVATRMRESWLLGLPLAANIANLWTAASAAPGVLDDLEHRHMDAVWHGMAQRPTINTGRFYGFLSSTQHVGRSEHRGVRWCTGIPWSSSKAPIHIHEKIIRGESGLWLHRLLHLHRMGSTVIPVIEDDQSTPEKPMGSMGKT